MAEVINKPKISLSYSRYLLSQDKIRNKAYLA